MLANCCFYNFHNIFLKKYGSARSADAEVCLTGSCFSEVRVKFDVNVFKAKILNLMETDLRSCEAVPIFVLVL
ncbi:MAG: hypothetical protein ABS871_01640 [Methanobrevibacter sp.]